MHDEDNALMEKVKNDDKSAYETLVTKYRTNAIYFAYSFISDLYESEDIVQECFAKIYINRMEYKPSHSFKTYLFAVIRNACVDFLRSIKYKNRRAVSLDHNMPEISNNNIPEDSFIKSERMTAILKNLDSLPNDYKTALYLFAVDEMTYEQIAGVMQKSIPQIKILMHRARKKLKKLCEGDDIFEN